MNFLIFIATIIGLYGFITKLSASGATLQLYFDREYTCPESFYSNQRKSDLLHAVNCFLVSMYALVILLFGVVFLMSSYTVLPSCILLYAALVNVLHMITNKFILRKTGLDDVMKKIKNQWKTQKKITKNNDDEVRLFRMIKESKTNDYYNLLYLILTIFMYFAI